MLSRAFNTTHRACTRSFLPLLFGSQPVASYATALAPTAQPVLEPVYLCLSPPLKRCGGHAHNPEEVVVLNPTVFNHPIRRDILHLCVNHYRDSLRQGSANTKTRAEVRGSGRKIRPQKGTGRARLGDGQSPMLSGGGVAFGPKPRDFSTKLPRKVIDMGMRVALSSKVKERNLGIMSQLNWPNGKTKHLAQRIDELGMRKTLFITGNDAPSPELERAIRSIDGVKLVTIQETNIYEVLKWPRVILDLKAVEAYETMLKKPVPVLSSSITLQPKSEA